jgi:diguanylate cyclase (GGDEF)-like protein
MPLAFGEEVMDELASRYPSGVERAEVEWERLGIDHAYAGAMFAEDSGLDEQVAAAIAWHHGGRRGCVTPSAEVACVQLANIVVEMLTGAAPDQMLLESALKALSLGPEVLDQLAESATSHTTPTATAGLGDRVAELERVASTDELTGIANRRHWMSSVRARIRAGEHGSVLLCDVDHFKQINDTHGHRTGDLVLMEVARILARHGTAGRIGGDEFALWVKADGTDSEVGEKIVAEVTAAFEGANSLCVGVSLGVAADVSDLVDAIELADRALYAAKAGGRRRASRAVPLPASATL